MICDEQHVVQCIRAQQSVHPTLGSLARFQAVFYALSFFWLDVGELVASGDSFPSTNIFLSSGCCVPALSLKCKPMVRNKEYFEIEIEDLQSVGRWAAACAERALSIYEGIESEDARPRNAINGIKDFSNSGKRTNHLRKLALDAYRASLETRNKAASAAAQSASLAAASAYTHPFKDVKQGRHILGPAVYSALAIELSNDSDPKIGDREIDLAIEHATCEIAGLLGKMPAQEIGKKRIDQLFYKLDRGLRNRFG